MSVYPPGSRQTYPPPGGGQYYAPYGYQPYPNYPYPSSYAPPPKSGLSGDKMVLIVVIVVVLVVLIPVVLAGILVVYLQTLPQGADNVETTLGLRSERIQTGDWVIAVVVGSHDAADVTVMVLDTAGAVVLSTRLTALNATDGAYHDNNMNGDLDAGDTILLKDTDKVDAGMKFQLLKGESIIGTIRQLPA